MWTGALRGGREADGETAGGERERGGLNGRSDDDVALSPLSMGELARPLAASPVNPDSLLKPSCVCFSSLARVSQVNSSTHYPNYL